MELTRRNVLFEVRRLNVGDFTWIARCRKTNDELVMPYIIERKRLDDLSKSIIDGRFHEQKVMQKCICLLWYILAFAHLIIYVFFIFVFQFRLKQSGIENLMYIVENIDKNSRFSIPFLSLLQASVNCLIQDGFTVKYTRNHKDSMSHLSYITKILIKLYKVRKTIQLHA